MTAAAKKAPAAATASEATTSTVLASQCRAHEEALRDAQSALSAAETAANQPHDDDQRRAVELASLHNARLRVESAYQRLADARAAHAAAELNETEAAAVALASEVSRAAQLRELRHITELFEAKVLGGLAEFLDEVARRRARTMQQARALDRLWSRLGNGYHLSGVDLETGTGRADIPPMTSLATSGAFFSHLHSQLSKQMGSLGHERARRVAAMFLVGGFEHDRQQHITMRAINELVHDLVAEGSPQ